MSDQEQPNRAEQKVEYINIRDLVLWSENPRDPVDSSVTDQEIVDRAINSKKWSLNNLARRMGDRYDFSELPTVVYHNDIPVVYDGNRRMILAKIAKDLANAPDQIYRLVKNKDFPDDIPCNVCEEAIAIDNVYRKHANSGSWSPLERDIFLHKFKKEGKSEFLILDEFTKIIEENPHLNQVFVKNEIFNRENLNNLGIRIENDTLYTPYTPIQLNDILLDISEKIKDKKITTRENRGNIIDVLDDETVRIINTNKNSSYNIVDRNYFSQDHNRPLC
jgi:hypothetical protein